MTERERHDDRLPMWLALLAMCVGTWIGLIGLLVYLIRVGR